MTSKLRSTGGGGLTRVKIAGAALSAGVSCKVLAETSEAAGAGGLLTVLPGALLSPVATGGVAGSFSIGVDAGGTAGMVDAGGIAGTAATGSRRAGGGVGGAGGTGAVTAGVAGCSVTLTVESSASLSSVIICSSFFSHSITARCTTTVSISSAITVTSLCDADRRRRRKAKNCGIPLV